jgi:hypothetical protein
MPSKSRSRRPDLLKVLVAALSVGMTLTLAYQLSLYHSAQLQPMADSAPATSIIDG